MIYSYIICTIFNPDRISKLNDIYDFYFSSMWLQDFRYELFSILILPCMLVLNYQHWNVWYLLNLTSLTFNYRVTRNYGCYISDFLSKGWVTDLKGGHTFSFRPAYLQKHLFVALTFSWLYFISINNCQQKMVFHRIKDYQFVHIFYHVYPHSFFFLVYRKKNLMLAESLLRCCRFTARSQVLPTWLKKINL